MPDRTKAPPSITPGPLKLPIPEKIEFSGGVELYHIADIQQEITSIDVVFKAGEWYTHQPGIPHFTAHMLEKGTLSKSSSQIAAFFDQYGAYIDVKLDFDFVAISLHALTKHLSTLLPLFFELLSEPAFPESELNKMKEAFIQNLAIKNKKTTYLASNLIREKIFGENHPYGRSIKKDRVEAIDVDYLHSFFEARMKASYLFVLGKVSTKDMADIKAHFGTVTPPPASKRTITPAPQKNTPRWVEKKDSLQSSIRLGKRTIPKTHPDYFNFVVLNYHLGGYFGSRLMQNLREKKGLTYGISSGISAFQYDSMLTIATEVNKESRASAVSEIRRELSLLAHNGIEKEAINTVKNHFLGSMNSKIASPFAVMSKIKGRVLQGLPPDFYHQLTAHIHICSPSELLTCAKAHFDESSFHEVSVG